MYVETRMAAAQGGDIGQPALARFLAESERIQRRLWDIAASNAELVKRVADLTGKYDRHPATPTEARALLGLRAG